MARGLHMTEYDLLHSRVLWTTEHDLGTESRVTKDYLRAEDRLSV